MKSTRSGASLGGSSAAGGVSSCAIAAVRVEPWMWAGSSGLGTFGFASPEQERPPSRLAQIPSAHIAAQGSTATSKGAMPTATSQPQPRTRPAVASSPSETITPVRPPSQ
jgi:hypothetical protein